MRFPRLRSHKIAPSVIVLFALALVIPSGFAQRKTQRKIRGLVTDQQNEPLRGAVVQVENVETQSIVSFITGRDGLYSFQRLDGDSEYQVWAMYRGQRSKSRPLSRFDHQQDRVLDFTVKLP